MSLRLFETELSEILGFKKLLKKHVFDAINALASNQNYFNYIRVYAFHIF